MLKYQGFHPVHKRFCKLFVCLARKTNIIVLIIGCWTLLSSSAEGQYLTSPGRPVISPIVETETLTCQSLFRNPALISKASSKTSCGGIQASQLYGITGLYLFETAIELPQYHLAFGVRTLKWSAYRRLEWISGTRFSFGEITFGLALNLARDQFPSPYYSIQRGHVNLGTFFKPAEALSVAILSENVLSRSIGRHSNIGGFDHHPQRRSTFAGQWQISPSFFLTGGARLDPSVNVQSEISLGWIPIPSVRIQLGQRTAPGLRYGNIWVRSKTLELGLSSYWHADLGNSLSISLSWSQKRIN